LGERGRDTDGMEVEDGGESDSCVDIGGFGMWGRCREKRRKGGNAGEDPGRDFVDSVRVGGRGEDGVGEK
jgi:hypothetical protein